MTRTIDFDAFRAEQKQEPVILHIGGTDYELAPALPASVAIDVLKLQHEMEDDNADVPFETLDKVGKAIFGDDVWEALLRVERIAVDEIPELISMVIKVYSPEVEKQDPPKAST